MSEPEGTLKSSAVKSSAAGQGHFPESIAVVIPTALVEGPDRQPLVAACLESLIPATGATGERANVRRRGLEVLLVTQGRVFDHPILSKMSRAGIDLREIDVPGPFNFSQKVNAGVAAATADVIFLLNDDVRMCEEDWPSVILDVLSDVTVGAVGPYILNPDGTLNAAGDALVPDGARHISAFDMEHRRGLADRSPSDREVILLTAAALAVPRSIYLEIGGFDEDFPSSYGDTDFCLRLGASGRRLICTSRVRVIHHESSSRDPQVPESATQLLRAKHPGALGDDPLLPPLLLSVKLILARAIGRPLRFIYRVSVRRFVQPNFRRRLSALVGKVGWLR